MNVIIVPQEALQKTQESIFDIAMGVRTFNSQKWIFDAVTGVRMIG